MTTMSMAEARKRADRMMFATDISTLRSVTASDPFAPYVVETPLGFRNDGVVQRTHLLSEVCYQGLAKQLERLVVPRARLGCARCKRRGAGSMHLAERARGEDGHYRRAARDERLVRAHERGEVHVRERHGRGSFGGGVREAVSPRM